VGDRLKAATAGQSRVITLAGKDRSAIMLGGHLADAAYWTEDTLMVTSSYYMDELPAWVRRFNASAPITRYSGQRWDRLLPQAAYRIAGPDDGAGEESPGRLGRTFPHQLSSGRSGPENFITAFQNSPFENEVIVDFAMEIVTQEGLGRDSIPDLLAIGFSANDLVGHSYGPDSHEVMDMTVRTDRVLERFFGFLQRQVGLDSILIVLTSDHGVAPLPERTRQSTARAQGARMDPSLIGAAAENALRARFGTPRRPGWLARPNWIMYQGWGSLYLNLAGLEDKNVSVVEAEQIAKEALAGVAGVERAITAGELMQQRTEGIHSRAELSFHPSRSGSVFFELSPFLLPQSRPSGTNHGSPWTYDTHVPLLWYGPQVAPGSHPGTVSVADIAPTLASLLEIPSSTAWHGRVLQEMLR
jgi:predicted AlkP superfamily pyrophosphatase or phosphodiesterase